MTVLVVTEKGNRAVFRREFQRSLKKCAEQGFSVEECFGVVWEETLDKTDLPESEQGRLYEELIAWAKQLSARS